MASPLTSTGSGGLDVQAIVDALMKVERRPLDQLDVREKAQNARISAYGTIKSLFASFQSAAAALGIGSGSKFSAFKVTSSDTSAITASAGSTAATASYSFGVTSLARAQSLVAAGQASKTVPISDGTATTVTIDFGTITGGTLTGGTYSGATFTSSGLGIQQFDIDGTNNTLEGIRDKINSSVTGVTASIVNDGTGTPYRLVLTSDSTGASSSLKITTSGGDGTIAALLGYDPEGTQNLNQTVAGSDAVFSVNNLPVTKASNSISDAIEGVTFNLLKEGVSGINLSVERDTDVLTDAVSAFVKAYNDLYNGLKNSSSYKKGSALEGDLTLRSLQSQLREIANSTVAGGTLSRLYEVGITFSREGAMQLDSAKLKAAMANDIDDVANLFNSAGGFATQFESFASSSLNSGGTIDSRINLIQNEISLISDQRATWESRMKVIEQRYRVQFSNLNVLLGSLNQTSNYLAQLASQTTKS